MPNIPIYLVISRRKASETRRTAGVRLQQQDVSSIKQMVYRLWNQLHVWGECSSHLQAQVRSIGYLLQSPLLPERQIF